MNHHNLKRIRAGLCGLVLAGGLLVRGAESVGVPAAEWPVFRGDACLTGVAKGSLPENLALLWSFPTGDTVKSSPVVGAGRVYIGSGNGKVYALSLATGSKLWEYDTTDAVEAPPLLVNNSIYIGSLKGVLFALAADTGAVRWQYETGGKIAGSANWVSAGPGPGTWILIGSYDNMMHCVDAATGKPVWTYETKGYINGSPAVADGTIVFGGCDSLVHVVSARNGQMLAEISAGAYVAGSAALARGRAYLGNYGNQLVCVDLTAKKQIWEYGQKDNGSPFFASPAVGADRVVDGSRDGYLHCVGRQDGQRLWTFKTRGDVDSSPVICGDKVVVGSNDGRLYVLRLADGKLIWTYEVGAPISGSPAVAGGRVIIGAEDGRVYAFGAKP